MKIKLFTLTLLVSASLISCVHKAPATPVAPPLTQEQMGKYMEAAGKVGPEHALFKNFVGTWKTEMRFWAAPGTEPQVSKGTSVNSLILGGRYLEQKFSGEAMGQKMQGIGVLGYDNSSKKYNSYWLDTLTTAISHSTGTFDAKAQKFSFDSTFFCPMVQAEKTMKEETQIKDKKHYSFTMYDVPANGAPVKQMEIDYTKIK